MENTFKLIGLNKRSAIKGVYATVQYGKEDWFHSDFDESKVPIDRQNALFEMFKNAEENLWSKANHRVVVEFDKYSSGDAPINPIIKELILDL